MTLKYVDRHGWMRWAEEKPGKYVSENGKWVIRKEGSRWRTYLKDHYDDKGRFLRLEHIPNCRTLREAQDWVDEFDVRGMDELLENPWYPEYLSEEVC
jgi:hypothetical protein